MDLLEGSYSGKEKHMSNGLFYANKAKTGVRHFCLKHRFLKSPRNGQHPERDQSEIGTRYEFT